jgi:beta-glucanase (GH16 family)
MRGRIDTRTGMWPAWWTLGNSGEWPSNGEIDIMEFYRGNVLANVACGTATRYQAKWDSVSKPISSFNDPQWSSKFHVWRMDWDDTKIDLYLDDVLMNTSNLADMLNSDGTSPFRQPDYMILNLAIGGQNGGDPAGTTFPARFEVDYVRVFQR